jgi:hypothetical protein
LGGQFRRRENFRQESAEPRARSFRTDAHPRIKSEGMLRSNAR